MCTTRALQLARCAGGISSRRNALDFKSRDWYTLPLLVLKQGTKGKVKRVTYEASDAPVKRMHNTLGVKSRQVTHKYDGASRVHESGVKQRISF